MFIYPPLRLDKVDYDSYWKDKRGSSIGSISDWQRERASYVIRKLKNETQISICDIACGDGSILNNISQKVNTSKLIGTDISTFALDKAKSFGVETVLLDIGNVDELNKIPEADYLLLFEILEHVPHSEELLAEAFGKADRGVFFSFPNTGFFVHRMRLMFGKFPMQWRLFPGEHVRFWTKKDLKWWLDSLGYKNYEVYYYKGLPILNILMPGLFAAAFVVYIPKNSL